MNWFVKFWALIAFQCMSVCYIDAQAIARVDYVHPDKEKKYGTIRIYHDYHDVQVEQQHVEFNTCLKNELCYLAKSVQPPLFLWEYTERESLSENQRDAFIITCAEAIRDTLSSNGAKNQFVNCDTVRKAAMEWLDEVDDYDLDSLIKKTDELIESSSLVATLQRCRGEGSPVPIKITEALTTAFESCIKDWRERRLPEIGKILSSPIDRDAQKATVHTYVTLSLAWTLELALLAKAFLAAYSGQNVIVFAGSLHAFGVEQPLAIWSEFKPIAPTIYDKEHFKIALNTWVYIQENRSEAPAH